MMGLFTPRYIKEGPGVRKDEPRKKAVARFFEIFGRKFSKLAALNLFYCLFLAVPAALQFAVYSSGLPDYMAFTAALLCTMLVGPATAGMARILICFIDEQPVFLISDFMDAFKENFKPASAIAALDYALVTVMTMAASFYSKQEGMGFFAAVPLGILLFAGLMLLFANFYMMPMAVKLKLGLRDIIKNAVLLAIVELKTNFITLLWCALIVVPCVLFFPLTILAIIPIAISVTGLIICFNVWPVIKRRCVAQEPGDPGMGSAEGQIFDDEAAFRRGRENDGK